MEFFSALYSSRSPFLPQNKVKTKKPKKPQKTCCSLSSKYINSLQSHEALSFYWSYLMEKEIDLDGFHNWRKCTINFKFFLFNLQPPPYLVPPSTFWVSTVDSCPTCPVFLLYLTFSMSLFTLRFLLVILFSRIALYGEMYDYIWYVWYLN